MRKYEIYLPLKYNDGELIESAKIVGVWDELADAFGGVTVSSYQLRITEVEVRRSRIF